MNIGSISPVKFTSNGQHDATQQQLRDLLEKRREMATNVIQNSKQYEMDKKISADVAAFFMGLTLSIQNDSTHSIEEIFGSEDVAITAQKKLSPECQQNSKDLREKLRRLDELKDPVEMLICANQMKNYAPKKGILSKEQEAEMLNGLKCLISTTVRKADLSKYSSKNKKAIMDMVQQIEKSKSTDFGIEPKLMQLIANLNHNVQPSFIPPVNVRQLIHK